MCITGELAAVPKCACVYVCAYVYKIIHRIDTPVRRCVCVVLAGACLYLVCMVCVLCAY